MPPRPTPIPRRLPPVDEKAVMPPPPLPPKAILEREVDALRACFRRASLAKGLIMKFAADTRRLSVGQYASEPPRSLTTALSYELERYDQLCDSLESKIQRAILILQRDLQLEQQRIKDAEAPAPNQVSSDISMSPTSSRTALVDAPDADERASASKSPSTSSIKIRRPSAISISSLHRPVPLKLDLPSNVLHAPPDDRFNSGLASPVTLAPKSARPMEPNELPPELMSVFGPSNASSTVDIDLTVPDNDPDNLETIQLDSGLGSSADKPIELDLESMDIDMNMSDLFGDEPVDEDGDANVNELFSSISNASNGPVVVDVDAPDKDGLFGDLSATDSQGGLHHDDIFASLADTQVESQTQNFAPTPGDAMSISTSEIQHADSPSTLLASFGSGSNDPHPGVTAENFDLSNMDLSFLSADQGSELMMNMESLMNIGTDTTSNNETK